MADLSARRLFEEAREAVLRLRDVQLALMFHCEDWRPAQVRARTARPDPTASRAIYNVDELDGRLAALRAEEAELQGKVGLALSLAQAVRDGLQDKYGDVLELYYIDRAPWDEIEQRVGLSRRSVWNYIDVACDWIDSVGLARIASGDLEV